MPARDPPAFSAQDLNDFDLKLDSAAVQIFTFLYYILKHGAQHGGAAGNTAFSLWILQPPGALLKSFGGPFLSESSKLPVDVSCLSTCVSPEDLCSSYPSLVQCERGHAHRSQMDGSISKIWETKHHEIWSFNVIYTTLMCRWMWYISDL